MQCWRVGLLPLLLLVVGACHRDRDRGAGESGSGSSLDVRLAQAESLYFRGQYDSARAELGSLLPEARRAGDARLEARTLTWLGLAAWRLGDFRSARDDGERALSLKLERGIDDEVARSYNALGLLAWHEGRLRDAARLFVRSRDHSVLQVDRRGIGRAVGNLGLIHVELADFDSARESFESAVDLAREMGDARMEADGLANRAMLHVRVGEAEEALPLLAEARRLYAAIDYPNGEQNALGQLATAYAARGQLTEAFAALDSAMTLARDHGLAQEEAAYHELLGSLHAEAGDLRRALKHLSTARAQAESLGLPLQVANILRSEAAAHALLGNTGHARTLARSALTAHQREGLRLEELDDRLLLAEILSLDAQPDSADGQLHRAASLASTLASTPASLMVRLTRARIADRAGRPDEVLRALEVADSSWMAIDVTSWWEPHALRARAYAAAGNHDAAVASGRRAVAEIEIVRRNLGGAPLRTAFLSHRSGVYADLVLNLLHAGRVADAFETADAARGRALLEHLSTVRQQLARAAPAGDQLERLLRQMDALMSRIAEIERAPDSERGESAVARGELLDRLRELRSRYEDLLHSHGVERIAISGETEAVVSLAAVQGVLAPDELLVQYVVSDDRLVILAVTSGRIRWFERMVTRVELRGAVRLAREVLSRPGTSSDLRVLHELRAILVAPLEGEGMLDDARRLIVVPHDVLTYLPFAALRTPDAGTSRQALLTLPSAAAFVRLHERRREMRASPARRLAAFAPFPQRLPASWREVRMVRREFRVSAGRIGPRATEASVRNALATSEIVHIASHALMNPHNAMFSRVELARGRPGTSRDDGRLEVHELLDIPINSRLVFLSACETALGSGWSTDYTPGEDFATLAQAFLLAGAGNVVATLWRIDDAGAAEFARRFYRHLRHNDPAMALTLTQSELRQEPAYRHPYYWAGYTLAGSGSEPGGSFAGPDDQTRSSRFRP